MPVTISYDLTSVKSNDRTYIRSMLERFHFKRLGGSVFRYSGVPDHDGIVYEDWLNHIVPAVMFFRSYILAKKIKLKFLTIDANSISMLDHSDRLALLGARPASGSKLVLKEPTNKQSSEQKLRDFVDAAKSAI